MLRMRFDDEINFDNYDKERLREQIQNPLFRAANKKLCLAFEQYEAEEQAVVVVREFLRENPGASFLKVIESTGVEIAILEKLIPSPPDTLPTNPLKISVVAFPSILGPTIANIVLPIANIITIAS